VCVCVCLLHLPLDHTLVVSSCTEDEGPVVVEADVHHMAGVRVERLALVVVSHGVPEQAHVATVVTRGHQGLLLIDIYCVDVRSVHIRVPDTVDRPAHLARLRVPLGRGEQTRGRLVL
jgi:hypothetical protein